MRILLISHTCISRTEGQPRAEELAKLPGVELKLVVPHRWRQYGSGNWRTAQQPENPDYDFHVSRVRLPWAGPAQCYLASYPALARIIRDFQPDIIDSWEETWSVVSAQCCAFRNRHCPDAKFVVEAEQNIEKRLPPPFRQLRKYILANADFAIGRSAEAVEVMRSQGLKSNAAVVPNAVDDELFQPLGREQCKSTLGLTGFTAGYIGRLVKEKGIFDMVDALDYCPPKVQLLFLGEGPQKEQLQRYVEEKKRSPQVQFLGGLPQHELPPVMNAMDTFVLASHTTPSWKEQFGRVIIEAQACGTPVIGSDSGAIPDVIGEGGLVVPEKNPEALGTAIARLSNDRELSEKLGRNGRKQVEEKYTWRSVAQRMHEIYSSLT